MSENYSINYYKTLIFIINLSGLSFENFAKKADISLSLISHADDSWNPKYSTVEKICSVVNISVTSFFNIAENLAGIKESITLNYVNRNDTLSPDELCKKLKDVRLSLKITEAQLAKSSGINKTNICNREHGKIKTQILCSTLEKYAASFGLSMSGLSDKLYEKE
ncbi:MAG: helix-turn-helix transcriptional regulator [Sphaerochaetaceae bacterium]|nr:helix-turn-helix transcriptional regulator [Sphaerochaetaceae bacterium]MDC7238397.1 helix-turn-helix transcriptional regulator [Sphaerochaetaceae bacterium]